MDPVRAFDDTVPAENRLAYIEGENYQLRARIAELEGQLDDTRNERDDAERRLVIVTREHDKGRARIAELEGELAERPGPAVRGLQPRADDECPCRWKKEDDVNRCHDCPHWWPITNIPSPF